jgi:cytochrome P450
MTGATISGKSIPGGTIVGIANIFVHMSGAVFEDPEAFNPDRWLGKDAKALEPWLVAFGKGPRSCLGSNLAWCDMYIAFATLLRRFEMKLDGTTIDDLVWRDCFTPHYYRRHLRVWCRPIAV